MNNSEIFEKKMKPSKVKLIIGLFFIAGCLVNEFGFYMAMKKEKDNPVPFNEIEKVGEYSCIDVSLISDGFADYSNDTETSSTAYYVFDDEYMYVASMDKKEYKRFDEIVEYYTSDEDGSDEPNPVRICGTAESIPSTLRKYGVEYYNKIYPNDKITNTTFDAYFKYYLDTSKGPEDDFVISSIVAGIFLLIGVIFIALYFRDGHKTKKTLAKYANDLEKIKMEIASPDTIYEPKARIFLTKERIINVANGMEIYDYKDIVWIYPHELRQNGYTTQRSIYVVTKDTKAHLIANINTSKKNNLMFEEIYESLLIRVPDALHGYTKENKDKVRELYKK